MGAFWMAPYSLLALVFFGSDCERWIFVLPPLFIVGGACLIGEPRRATWAAGILTLLLAANLWTGILPAHRDADGTRFRAESSARALAAGDLIVFPGHGWDEYISWFAPAQVEPFPVAYYAARDGVDACFQRLGREIDAARARGGRVYTARLFDEIDDDRRGWDELSALGLPRAAVRERVLAVRPSPTLARATPLARLDWP